MQLICEFCFLRRYFQSVLGDLITSRKETILKSLQDADNKLREAEENFAFAKKAYEMAKVKAEQIKEQGVILSSQTSKTLLEAAEEDIKRLKSSNLSAIRFEEEKSVNEVVFNNLLFILFAFFFNSLDIFLKYFYFAYYNVFFAMVF